MNLTINIICALLGLLFMQLWNANSRTDKGEFSSLYFLTDLQNWVGFIVVGTMLVILQVLVAVQGDGVLQGLTFIFSTPAIEILLQAVSGATGIIFGYFLLKIS